jgi:hypothetical protein
VITTKRSHYLNCYRCRVFSATRSRR